MGVDKVSFPLIFKRKSELFVHDAILLSLNKNQYKSKLSLLLSFLLLPLNPKDMLCFYCCNKSLGKGEQSYLSDENYMKEEKLPQCCRTI